jgi:hypothetical protein
MKRTIPVIIIYLLFLIPSNVSAWGPEGHAIVGRIALNFLKPDVKANVVRILAICRWIPRQTGWILFAAMLTMIL